MGVKQIIPAFSINEKGTKETGVKVLEISEFFFDTIQGEGIYIGHPAAFLRLKGCTLNCNWCDTQEVWRQGDFYDVFDIIERIETSGLAEKLKDGMHLVITGGSPVRQQYQLNYFLNEFREYFGFQPFVELENECTILPVELWGHINCWNNSPKLSNSENSLVARYKPAVIRTLSSVNNSWFKFVVDCEEDWEEIEGTYLEAELIKKEQIIIMPKGATKRELDIRRPMAVEMAVRHNVRFTDRLHVTIWDKKTGV